MDTAPPPPPPPPAPPEGQAHQHDAHDAHDGGPRVSGPEVRDLGRLRRVREGRNVAGVAGGLARHLDIDPLVVKILFVVLSFFGGAGIIVYGACWLLVPVEGTERAVVTLDERSRTVLLVVVGVIATLALLGDSLAGPGVGFGFPWPLVVIGVVLVAVLLARGSTRPHPWTVAPPPSAPAPGAPATSYPAQVPPPRPRDPRRRGPLLFWFTMALAALGIGVLLTLELAGLSVPGSAYPATVLAACGLMLLVGAFYGRAGGLVAVGLLALLVTAGATVGGEVDGGQVLRTPVTAQGVASSYDLGAGEIVLDLTEVDDLEALDGRTVALDVDLGRIEVVVPDDLTVVVDGEVRGDGEANVLGGRDADGRHDGGPGAPELRLEPSIGFGQIEVRVEDDGVLDRFDQGRGQR